MKQNEELSDQNVGVDSPAKPELLHMLKIKNESMTFDGRNVQEQANKKGDIRSQLEFDTSQIMFDKNHMSKQDMTPDNLIDRVISSKEYQIDSNEDSKKQEEKILSSTKLSLHSHKSKSTNRRMVIMKDNSVVRKQSLL